MGRPRYSLPLGPEKSGSSESRVDADGPLPDRELLERFLRERDEAAFAALVRRHGPME